VNDLDAQEAEEEEYRTWFQMGLAPTDEEVRTAGGDNARVKASELECIAQRAEYLRSTQSQSQTDANHNQKGLRAS
jgi:hypothetical protein